MYRVYRVWRVVPHAVFRIFMVSGVHDVGTAPVQDRGFPVLQELGYL